MGWQSIDCLLNEYFIPDWLADRGLSPNFEALSEEHLASQLKIFYAEVRRRNGELYSRQSMLSLRSAVYRHLIMPPHNKTFNILKDPLFTAANNVFIGSLKKMKKDGMDKSSHYPAIGTADLKKMYDSNVLSNHDPTALQRKIFFELLLHFGRRGKEGLRQIRKGQIIFSSDENGQQYATLDCNPHEKNHQSAVGHELEHKQVMYGTGVVNCPLESLRLYVSKLNKQCEQLFQRPKIVNWASSLEWYRNCPIGVNTLAKMMSEISKAAGLSKIYTNHSIRATCVTTLREKGVAPTDIMAVTGHRNVASIESYSRGPSAEMRAKMSHKLAETSLAGRSCSSNGTEHIDSAISTSILQAEATDEDHSQKTLPSSPITVSSTIEMTRNLFQNVVFNNSTINVHIHKT